jgi:Uncharacterised protein conserved in bacteria (DUF2336)
MACIEISESKGCGVAVANSSNNDILTGLGDRPGSDMTARLLLALTALYVERPTHAPPEQQQYLELALRLIDRVDAGTRTTVAGILRRLPDAPTEIFARLEGPQPSSHVDKRESDGGPSAAAATAPAIAPSPAAMQAAPAPLPRPTELGEAFFAASAAERRSLLSRLATKLDKEDVPPQPQEGNEEGEQEDKQDRMHEREQDGERLYGALDAAAMQGRIGEFSREFERLLAMPKSLCERILNDRSGEPMVVAAKAAGMPIAVLQRILLLVNPAVSHSVQRVYDLTDLYHGLDRGAALRLVAVWRAQAKPNDPAAEAKGETRLDAGERKSAGLRDTSVAGLRSRFGALTERVQGQGMGHGAGQAAGQGASQGASQAANKAVNVRPDPGNVARRDLRSR